MRRLPTEILHVVQNDRPTRIGRYTIVDRLGQGGMGLVYRAWDPDLRRTIALKTISVSPDVPMRNETIERFLREARAAASLSHPNIVTVYDIGQEGGRPFIAMEFIEGESLAQMIERRAELTLTEKLRIAGQMCRGLAHAHSYGVVHRDVKPANLLIAADGTLKVADFGLARMRGEVTLAGLTQPGALIGTLHYLSPEQVSGLDADERSDIFSVGAVLHELFTYQRAFESSHPSAVLFDILHTDPVPVSRLAPEAPTMIEGIVSTALRKDVTTRYQNLDEVIADLDRASAPTETPGTHATARPDGSTESAPITPPPVAPGQNTPQQRPRLREGAAIAVAVIALIVFAVFGRPETSPPVGRAPSDTPLPAETEPVLAPVPPSIDRGVTTPPARQVAATRGTTTNVNTTSDADTVRCRELLEQASLGEELGSDDRNFLSRQCRGGAK